MTMELRFGHETLRRSGLQKVLVRMGLPLPALRRIVQVPGTTGAIIATVPLLVGIHDTLGGCRIPG